MAAERDLAVDRVASRAQQGGHSVPEVDVRRRFTLGLRNLFQFYRTTLDAWGLYDASRLPPELIAWEEEGTLIAVDANLFNDILRGVEE